MGLFDRIRKAFSSQDDEEKIKQGTVDNDEESMKSEENSSDSDSNVVSEEKTSEDVDQSVDSQEKNSDESEEDIKKFLADVARKCPVENTLAYGTKFVENGFVVED